MAEAAAQETWGWYDEGMQPATRVILATFAGDDCMTRPDVWHTAQSAMDAFGVTADAANAFLDPRINQDVLVQHLAGLPREQLEVVLRQLGSLSGAGDVVTSVNVSGALEALDDFRTVGKVSGAVHVLGFMATKAHTNQVVQA